MNTYGHLLLDGRSSNKAWKEVLTSENLPLLHSCGSRCIYRFVREILPLKEVVDSWIMMEQSKSSQLYYYLYGVLRMKCQTLSGPEVDFQPWMVFSTDNFRDGLPFLHSDMFGVWNIIPAKVKASLRRRLFIWRSIINVHLYGDGDIWLVGPFQNSSFLFFYLYFL